MGQRRGGKRISPGASLLHMTEREAKAHRRPGTIRKMEEAEGGVKTRKKKSH